MLFSRIMALLLSRPQASAGGDGNPASIETVKPDARSELPRLTVPHERFGRKPPASVVQTEIRQLLGVLRVGRITIILLLDASAGAVQDSTR
jgi:hypothetical protein